MSEKRLCRLLVIEAVVCALLAAALRIWPVAGEGSEMLTPILSVLLRAGRFGFAAGVTLISALILLPVYLLLRAGKTRTLEREDALLPAASIATGVTFWYGCVAGAKSTMGYLTWLGLLLALLAAYFVLRLLRRFREGGTAALLAQLRLLLCVAAGYFVFLVAFGDVFALLGRFSALRSAGTAVGVFFSGMVLLLRAVAGALPQVCAAVAVLRALPLLNALSVGKLTEEAAHCAHKLAAWCFRALRCCVLFTLTVNALQAVLFGMLTDISIQVDVPIFELCFVLLALLGARLVESAAQLQAENDLIV